MTDMSSLLFALRKIDRSGLMTRDVLLMESVRQNPGSMGREVALRLGANSRSNIQSAIPRLVKLGMIEDRRQRHDRCHANNFYVTPAGEKFLDELIPQHDL